ncbi:MAG: LSU ribosomal protein L22p (L17e) [Parcubacteria group bacterium Athens0714_26]|nr:MAG: LSU ribosomal protein L22p (L17e) [Parcubacteria group bacterium Athens1014_26]TSD03270.1 MAG: LSU ribosomal protein L22p (L17e) [Parcubacteria group bacterium Athens0714_26]
MNTETVKLKFLHIAPRKVRLVANALRGLRVNEAEAQLLMRPQRSSYPILKLLRSGIANAVHNKKMDVDRLFIDKILVDQGPSLKRSMPRAMGRATPILKRTSHITLVLIEVEKKRIPRFNIITKKPKKAKKIKETKIKPKDHSEKEAAIKPKEKSGFMKKIFSRKSI